MQVEHYIGIVSGVAILATLVQSCFLCRRQSQIRALEERIYALETRPITVAQVRVQETNVGQPLPSAPPAPYYIPPAPPYYYSPQHQTNIV